MKAITILTIALVSLTNFASAQSININARTHMVMRGNVQLVVNNAAFKNNNGNFNAANGTVVLSGNADTTTSYVGGTSATTFYNLTVNKSANGARLNKTANVRNTLSVNAGTLYADSNLVLKSDAALTARVAAVPAGANIVGKAHVERFVPARRAWRLMTAPVASSNTIYNTWQNGGTYTEGRGTYVTGPNPSNANGLDVSPLNNVSLKMWNYTTQAFTNVTNTKVAISAGAGTSAANTGYFVFLRGDRTESNFSTAVCNSTTLTVTGNLQVGNQSFTASATSGAMTLIGNPYAAPIDFGSLNRTNLMNRFYVWDPTINTLGGYVMMDDLGNTGTYTKSVAASNQTRHIQSSQAFFVQTLNNGAASVSFTENSKSTENNNLVFRPSTVSTEAGAGVSQFLRTNLYIVNNDGTTTLADGLFAEFNAQYSDSVKLEDAPKFININENMGLQRGNTTLAAERRPFFTTTDTLQLRIWKTAIKTYQFEFIPTNIDATEIYLIDKYLNTATSLDITNPTTINFSIDANTASQDVFRFKIVLKKASVLPVTLTNVKAFQQNNQVAVEWKVENEIDMSQYVVEKSANGTSFSAMATVNARNGNAYTYNSIDQQPIKGNNFYRIKTIDNNGQVKYSSIVKVTIGGSNNSSMVVYPNPVKNSTINLQMQNQPVGKYNFQLTNTAGQVIYNGTMNNNSSNGTIAISVPTQLNTGIYQLQVVNPNNNKQTLQVIAE